MRHSGLKRATLGVLALLLSSGAFAQWSLLGRNENLRIYLADSEIRRNGDIAQMWQMYDYVIAQWIGNRVIYSVRNLVEYDCAGKRSRTIAGAAYSEQMGRGTVVASEEAGNAEWAEVPAGGSQETMWQVACGKN